MRTVLICHHDEPLNRDLMPRWLASFSELAGILLVKEGHSAVRQRCKRELNRVGPIRILDVFAFRLFYKLLIAKNDQAWENRLLHDHNSMYPDVSEKTLILETDSPNGKKAEKFLRDCNPDLVLARCKHLLKPRIFEIPPLGTYVLHPGICPEYRNAHGCFWALVNRDLEKVGSTLLKIDRGIDTGPIYNYFSYSFDELNESHVRIQDRVVFENLDAIKNSLLDIEAGRAEELSTLGLTSGNWGQPWFSAWCKWKIAARRNKADKL